MKDPASVNSHIVPKSVLRSLCIRKAGTAELPKTEESKYMFRTDIEQGKEVSCTECTTRLKKLLCESCECQLDCIDKCAARFWKSMELDYIQLNNMDIDITTVVLFSMMVRAMCVSLPWASTGLLGNNIADALETMMSDPQLLDYQNTKEKLNNIGFVYCHLNRELHMYRVEFPFLCALRLRQMTIPVICLQVPPFFCLMPVESTPNHILNRNIEHISDVVNQQLNEKLEEFCDKAQTNMKNKLNMKHKLYSYFHKWLKRSGELENILLVFDYLETEQPLYCTLSIQSNISPQAVSPQNYSHRYGHLLRHLL